MAVKIYRAYDLRQALADARLDLGPNAAVLSQRQLRSSRWWPFSRPMWEVIASEGETAKAETHEPDERTLQLESEIAEIKGSLNRLVRSINLDRLCGATKALTECYEMLCDRGLDSELAKALVLAARDELSTLAQSQHELVRAAVRRQLEKQLNTRLPKVIPGRGALVIFVFGQAGVGKTTTLLKLAARLVLYEDRRVAIVNADTARPASQLQIEFLAKPFDLVVETVISSHPQALQSALATLGDRDVIFVDTPGYGWRERAQIHQLDALVKVAPRRQSFLVLGSSIIVEELDQILQGFRPIGLDGLVFSKVDETELTGTIVTLSCQSPVPVAYITTGRRIPDDIEPASPERLSALIFGGAGSAAGELSVKRPVLRKQKKQTSVTTLADSDATDSNIDEKGQIS